MERIGVAAIAAVVLVMLGCGPSGGPGVSKAAWERGNGELVAAYSRDLDDALDNINQGARAVTVGSCTQVADDAKELGDQAFPVPDGAVDAALRKAVEAGRAAAASCLAGSRGGGARDIERAQAEFADARRALDAARAAITAWT